MPIYCPVGPMGALSIVPLNPWAPVTKTQKEKPKKKNPKRKTQKEKPKKKTQKHKKKKHFFCL